MVEAKLWVDFPAGKYDVRSSTFDVKLIKIKQFNSNEKLEIEMKFEKICRSLFMGH